MTCCSLQCEGRHALRKEQTCQKRIELQALRSYRNGPAPLLQEELDLEETSPQMYSSNWEPKDQLFLTCLFSELIQVDLWAMATTSQRLVEEARHSKETLAATSLLPTYVTEFQSVFTKEDFDILPEHCKWDYAIELIPGAEPKSSKIYLLFLLE